MRYIKGPLGALMDEYERAANEFIATIDNVPPFIYDDVLNTSSERDLVSIKNICFHVLFAGYGYANAIRSKFGTQKGSPEKFYPAHSEFRMALRTMLAYTDDTLTNLYSMSDDDLTATNIPLRWSDHHDLEALMEHAICHVLRHRRQVERLLAQAVSTTSVSSETTGP